MSKPSKQELAMALEQARYLRESGEDSHFLGKALLNCNYQMRYLLDVFHAAELYFQSGMSEIEHTRLLKAIEKARQIDDYTSHREHTELGL
jgi:hypothetical protein